MMLGQVIAAKSRRVVLLDQRQPHFIQRRQIAVAMIQMIESAEFHGAALSES